MSGPPERSETKSSCVPFSPLTVRLLERGLNGFSKRVSKISPGSEFSGHAGRA